MINTTSAIATQTRNKFESEDEFKSFVRQAFIERSAIHPELFDACVEFHQDQEFDDGHEVSTPIHEALGWDFKRFGHQANENLYAAFLKNEDGTVWQAIVSIWDEEKQRPYRYLAPKGIGDRAFLPPIPPGLRKQIGEKYGIEVPASGSFWEWVQETDIPRVVTEGGKKGLCGLSRGYVAIALYGCACGAKNKDDQERYVKPYLTCDLERFAGEDSRWLFAFDRDESQKAKLAVASGKKKLRLALAAVGCPTIDIMWKAEDGKGLDDFMKISGGGGFDTAYQKAIAKLEKQFTVREDKQWTQSLLGKELAEGHRPKLAWHTGNKCWYWYGRKQDGMWFDVSDEFVGQLVTSEAEIRMGATFNHDLIAGTIKFLKYALAVDDWEETKGLIPLQDGVLDPKTMQLLPHSPGYRFLWQLPYKWQDRAIGCQPVTAWFSETMQHNPELVQMLRAYLKAVVMGRSDLHRFLEGIGPGGTGKSTFQRLATALVGKENTLISTLKQLETNRFETAALYGKRLLLITDSERYGGEVSTLKAITGEDEVRNERKNVQQTRGFKFPGMVIVMANEPIQSSDYTSGLKRRRLAVPFTHQTPPQLQRDLESEFKLYLPGVLQWVLSLPDAEMEQLVKDTQNSVRSLAAFSAEFLVDTNPLAEWLDNCAVVMPTAKTYVGTLEKSVELYLYPNYCKWMQNTGSRALSLRRFSENLIDLCSNQLKLQGITKGRDNQGAYITGITLRGYGMSELPRPITNSDGSVTDSDGSVTGQTRTSDVSDGCDGLIPSAQEKIVESTLVEDSMAVSRPLPSHSSVPSLTSIPSVTQPVTVMGQSITDLSLSPSPTEATPRTSTSHNFTVGDVVQVLGNRKLKDKRVTISTIDSTGIWVKEQKTGFRITCGPFQPHQLYRC